VHPVCGDLTKERFGLGNLIYKDLLDKNVTHIFHNGAHVNMTLPYQLLKPVNVMGTLSVIRLALESGGDGGEGCERRGAHISYVSTVGALPSKSYSQEEFLTSVSNSEMEAKPGYGQSKAVAEQLICKASLLHKVPVSIFRPCAISGSSISGYTNTLDFTTLLLTACVTLKSAPKNSTMFLNWVTVDYVAKSIVALSFRTTGQNEAYHLLGNGGPSLNEIFTYLQKMGYTLNWCSRVEWASKLNELPTTHPAFPVKFLMENAVFSGGLSSLPKQRTEEILNTLGIKSSVVTSSIFTKYVNYQVEKGYLPSPDNQ